MNSFNKKIEETKKETSFSRQPQSSEGIFGKVKDTEKPFSCKIGKDNTQSAFTWAKSGDLRPVHSSFSNVSQGTMSSISKPTENSDFMSKSSKEQLKPSSWAPLSISKKMAKSNNDVDIKVLSEEIETHIIQVLSQQRQRAWDKFIELIKARLSAAKVSDPQSVKESRFCESNFGLIESPSHQNKDFTKLNVINFKDFKATLYDVLEEYSINQDTKLKPSDEHLLNTVLILSDVLFNLHFVKREYQPLFARNLIRLSHDELFETEEYKEKFLSYSWERKLFEYLKYCQFEQAFDLSYEETSSYKRHKGVYDTILEIISPIRSYFKNGIDILYQLEDVIYMFSKMNDNARAFLTQIDFSEVQEPEFIWIKKSLQLLSGDIDFQDKILEHKDEERNIFEEIALLHIYQFQCPWEKEIIQIKTKLHDKYVDSKGDEEAKLFNIELISYAWDSPYETFPKLRLKYPKWFSENIIFLWDASSLLISENLRLSLDDASIDFGSKIIEYIEAEYVRYLLSKKQTISIISPYLTILEDEELKDTLFELMHYDFTPGSKESFKTYESIYKNYIAQRSYGGLIDDYEILKQLQGDFFLKQEENKQTKENFYKGLKHLAKKTSIKAFNNKIIEMLDLILKGELVLNDIVDNNIDEYRTWQKKSRPFMFLASYLELIEADSNIERDKILKGIFTAKTIQLPYAFKINIIQKMSEIMLREDVSISQDLILSMIIEFEKFESRSSAITGKYFGDVMTKPNNSSILCHKHLNPAEIEIPFAERQLIRYALNQGLTQGMILS